MLEELLRSMQKEELFIQFVEEAITSPDETRLEALADLVLLGQLPQDCAALLKKVMQEKSLAISAYNFVSLEAAVSRATSEDLERAQKIAKTKVSAGKHRLSSKSSVDSASSSESLSSVGSDDRTQLLSPIDDGEQSYSGRVEPVVGIVRRGAMKKHVTDTPIIRARKQFLLGLASLAGDPLEASLKLANHYFRQAAWPDRQPEWALAKLCYTHAVLRLYQSAAELPMGHPALAAWVRQWAVDGHPRAMLVAAQSRFCEGSDMERALWVLKAYQLSTQPSLHQYIAKDLAKKIKEDFGPNKVPFMYMIGRLNGTKWEAMISWNGTEYAAAIKMVAADPTLSEVEKKSMRIHLTRIQAVASVHGVVASHAQTVFQTSVKRFSSVASDCSGTPG